MMPKHINQPSHSYQTSALPNKQQSQNRQTREFKHTFHTLQDLSLLKEQPETPDASLRFNHTYTLVSLMMYLIGVEERHFTEHIPDLGDHFQRYQANACARVIRNLCIIRTALQRNCKDISYEFQYNLKSIASIPAYVDPDVIRQLYTDGVSLHKSRPAVDDYVILINQEISNRLQTVQPLFPEWIKWAYVRPLFIMPNGFKPEGVKAARADYNADRNRFPFQCYINWDENNCGNLLHSDDKFTRLLYTKNNDCFEDRSLVRGAGDRLLDDLYAFIGQSKKTLVVVDCENSNPVKLAAALSSLNRLQRSLIHKIMLFDSDYTTAAWKVLTQSGFTEEFETEHIVVKRLNERKSQVDMTLAANTCREVYTNGVDSVILVSSDSDYWALIQSLPGIHFLTMVERHKAGQHIISALEENHYHYCYIDDFCTSASYAIKTRTLLGEMQDRLDAIVDFNVKDMLDEVVGSTWLRMSTKEKEMFYDRYLKKMQLKIEPNGQVKITLE